MKSNCTSGDVIMSMSDSLRKLLESKNFDQISITEIVNLAYVNRNSFYYHFKSKNDLAIVMLSNELNCAKRHYDSGGHLTVFDIAQMIYKEKHIFSNLLCSSASEAVSNYLYNELANYVVWLIDDKYSCYDLTKEDADILIGWHTESCVSMLKNWLNCQHQYQAPFLEPCRDAAIKATVELVSKSGIQKDYHTKTYRKK